MSNTKNPEIDEMGTKRWYDEEGKLHREDGPASVWANGHEAWYRHGKLHRDDGPAAIGADGHEIWCRHGLRHRDDGPAYVGATGAEHWFRHGVLYEPTETELVRWELKKAMEAYEKQL